MEDDKYLYFFGANICAIIVFYYKAFLSEKAKNQATKEDIEEITHKIESVKSEFIKQNEELKANLSLATQHKLNLKKIETDVIFDFNRVLLTWIVELLKFNIMRYRLDNFQEAKVKIVEINGLRKELKYREANLSIFITNEQFFIDLYKLQSAGFEYETLNIHEIEKLKDLLTPFKEEFQFRNEFITSPNEELLAFEIRVSAALDKFRETATYNLKPHFDKCKSLLAEYNKSILKILRAIDNDM